MIVVTCKPEQKVQRFAQRAGIDEAAARAEVERRTKAQMPDEQKIKRADYVIDNSGPLEHTRHQVEKIFAELKALAVVS
jgi:dephospho-CoA kinase